MDLRYGFATAATGEWIVPSQNDDDYLIVTAYRVLPADENAAPSNHQGRWLLRAPLGNEPDADKLMKSVVDWLCENHGLDQSAIHTNEYDQYNITMVRFPKDSFPGIIGQFYLTDYLFNDRRISDIREPDDLMRMLDRDRLAHYMRDVLVNDLNFAKAENPDLTWIQDFRRCCHPDYPPIVFHKPAFDLLYA